MDIDTLWETLDRRQETLVEMREELTSYALETVQIVGQALESLEASLAVIVEPVQRGHLTLDSQKKAIHWRGEFVHTTPREFYVIWLMSRRHGRIFSRTELMDYAWKNVIVDDRSVDSAIKRIRIAFREVDPNFNEIRTLYNSGYAWGQE